LKSQNRLSIEGPAPSFSRALWRIASADVSCGNVVTLLRDGPGALTRCWP
jgi:hypothetical protein